MFIAYLMSYILYNSLKKKEILFYSSFVHKFRLREKPLDDPTTAETKGYECLCIGSQNLGTVRMINKKK